MTMYSMYRNVVQPQDSEAINMERTLPFLQRLDYFLQIWNQRQYSNDAYELRVYYEIGRKLLPTDLKR